MERTAFKSLLKSLRAAGFPKSFVEQCLLPDWWDESCATDPAVMPEVELRVARFLRCSVEDVRSLRPLGGPSYPGAQMRRVRDVDRDRLAPAIHAALQIAAATVRTLRDAIPVQEPPADAQVWRDSITSPGRPLTLDQLVGDLWRRGIPVIPITHLPSPSFQGLAGHVEGRPVVVIHHRHDQPGRVAFVVAHEAGHIAAGDCSPGEPVVDQVEEIADKDGVESRADSYATRVLVGADSIPAIDGSDFRTLARKAFDVEEATGADAGSLIFAWARRTGDYARAQQAVKALHRDQGGRAILAKHFESNVALEEASDTDRSLLRCVEDPAGADESPR